MLGDLFPGSCLQQAGQGRDVLQAGMWHPGHCCTFTKGCGEAARDPPPLAVGVTGQKIPCSCAAGEMRVWELWSQTGLVGRDLKAPRGRGGLGWPGEKQLGLHGEAFLIQV